MNGDELKIGEIINRRQSKDAIHIAVLPVRAMDEFMPGEKVCLVNGTDAIKCNEDSNTYHGVVDPYLLNTVKRGERFWLFMRPGSITSLRHDWTHPALIKESEEWLRDFAERYKIDYNQMIDGAVDGSGCCFGSSGYSEELDDEFWDHVENVTNQRLNRNHRENTYFHCSC